MCHKPKSNYLGNPQTVVRPLVKGDLTMLVTFKM